MEIVVFDTILNHGGGIRFITSLLTAVKQERPDIKFTFYCDLDKLKKLNVIDALNKHEIRVCRLDFSYDEKLISLSNLLGVSFYLLTRKKINLPEKLRKSILARRIKKFSKRFDLAFFPWPYFFDLPSTFCPKVAVFHDFNFKYFFGMPIFNEVQSSYLDTSIGEWLKNSIPVVSTNFMHDELKKFYPETSNVNVVHLPSLSPVGLDKNSNHINTSSLIPEGKYFLCSAHIVFHKNIGNVIAALALFNAERVEKIKLIITGFGTEFIKGESGYIGLERNNNSQFDVVGMGYVDDVTIEQLISHSIGVINASLYEAGNGVGLDAWRLGVPVLQSAIPPFREHIEFQGYRAFEFDARNPLSIANAMQECIEQKFKRDDNIIQSLNASKLNDWTTAAKKYINIFESAISK